MTSSRSPWRQPGRSASSGPGPGSGPRRPARRRVSPAAGRAPAAPVPSQFSPGGLEGARLEGARRRGSRGQRGRWPGGREPGAVAVAVAVEAWRRGRPPGSGRSAGPPARRAQCAAPALPPSRGSSRAGGPIATRVTGSPLSSVDDEPTFSNTHALAPQRSRGVLPGNERDVGDEVVVWRAPDSRRLPGTNGEVLPVEGQPHLAAGRPVASRPSARHQAPGTTAPGPRRPAPGARYHGAIKVRRRRARRRRTGGQKFHPAGASGQDGSGRQPGSGRHPAGSTASPAAG